MAQDPIPNPQDSLVEQPAPKEIRTVEELKEKLGRVRQLLAGHQSYHSRFAALDEEIKQLKERLRKLEPPNSPPDYP